MSKFPSKFTSKEKLPCECGHNRWKTKHKQNPTSLSSLYECRKCGKERMIGWKEAQETLSKVFYERVAEERQREVRMEKQRKKMECLWED